MGRKVRRETKTYGAVTGEQAAAKLRMAGIMRARKCIKSRLIAESDISVAR